MLIRTTRPKRGVTGVVTCVKIKQGCRERRVGKELSHISDRGCDEGYRQNNDC